MSNETPWSTLAAGLTRLSDRLDALPTIREATIVSLVPLAVQFDTDTSNTIVQGSLASGVTPGYRVLTLKLRHYVWILGIKGGDKLGGMTGEVRMFAGTSPPAGGWLLCRGQEVSRTTYADLYALLGDTYGAGNGTSTFNLPNLKGRVAVGLDSGQTEFDILGETGGAKTHTLTQNEMPSHSHAAPSGYFYVESLTGSMRRSANINNAGSAGEEGVWRQRIAEQSGGPLGTGGTGGNQAHNNLQPYIVLNYIIKVI